MLYEGIVEITDDLVNVDLKSPLPQDSQYSLQFGNSPELLARTMQILKPCWGPDEEPEAPESYAKQLSKKGFGSFYSDSQNIQDLINLYANTEPKQMNPFPGLSQPRSSKEIIFIETIRNFMGKINNKLIENKTVQFRYRGVLQ